MSIKFVCPECQHDELECCLNGSHTCPITEIEEGGDFEYGEYESTADVDRYQCAACGYVLESENDTLTSDEEVAEWCKEHCSQE
jgi:rubredoxin